MKIMFLIVSGVGLAACNSTSHRTTESPYARVGRECMTTAPEARQVRCAAAHPLFSKFTPQQQELVLYSATIEDKLEKKQLSKAEAEYAIVSYKNRLNQQQASINAQQQAANAAAVANQQAASDALLIAGGALMAAGAPQGGTIYAPPPQQSYPRSTTCMGGYRSVTCNNF